MADVDALQNQTVTQLKLWLHVLGLRTSGNKSELLLRLLNVPKEKRDKAMNETPNTEDTEDDDDDDNNDNNSQEGNKDEGCEDDSSSDTLTEEDDENEREREKTSEKRQAHNEGKTNKNEWKCMKREIKSLKKELELHKRENNMLMKENQHLKRKCEENKIHNEISLYKFSNLKDFLPEFSGVGDYFEHWEVQLNNLQEVYGLDEKNFKLLISSRLKGKALQWFHSRADITLMSSSQILLDMKELFGDHSSRLTLKRALESRKWSPNETFQQYFHDMTILSNRLSMESEEIIEIIIDGIPDQYLQSQARMQRFKTKQELLAAFCKIQLPKTTTPSTSRRETTRVAEQKTANIARCYNCNILGHMAYECKKPKRERGACHVCGEMGHLAAKCQKRKKLPAIGYVDGDSEDEYVRNLSFILPNYNITKIIFSLDSLLDTGSPVSLIKLYYINKFENEYKIKLNYNKFLSSYVGINKSPLCIIGQIKMNVLFNEEEVLTNFLIVPDDTMQYPVILGRDFIKRAKLTLQKVTENSNEKMNDDVYKNECKRFLNIISNDSQYLKQKFVLPSKKINDEDFILNNELPYRIKQDFFKIFQQYYLYCSRPEVPEVQYEMRLRLNDEKPFHCPPRRMSYFEKEQVQKILDDLIEQGVIRESRSEYASPVVLVRKKTGDIRLCVDYRTLNKATQKDNYPIPLIDDLLDGLVNKKFFTLIDLKSAFHHIQVNEESVKYTSFVTPMGQYEYLKMPFGLRNAPCEFQRYINRVFEDLIRKRKVTIYIDDIMIATETEEEHLELLKEVFGRLVKNNLQLRLDKCQFMASQVRYLGYYITDQGVKPDEKGVESIKNFPIPQNVKALHSFLGLCSYFRRFVKNFSLIAQPLYNLIRKDAVFKFGKEELECFEELKKKMSESPVLAIFNPRDETELHCDASSLGFGAILLQKKSDGKFHPVMYFSKRTTNDESKYHSFELETLAIIYALRRFRVYLHGYRFKIVTDCNSLTLTLNKKEVNPRIARWALELQNFDYVLEHRNGSRMQHVDALSRVQNILVLEENNFEQNLSIQQNNDKVIKEIRRGLEEKEDKLYEMRNGLVYKKKGKHILFYVPAAMETNVIRLYHDEMGHVGRDKVLNNILKTYWFPRMSEKVKEHIANCLKCIAFSPKFGKHEGLLHSIPKGNVPFEMIHIDHFGPVSLKYGKKKYVFLIIDGFTKFVRLYAVKSTNTREVSACLKNYFNSYSRPSVIISDRGSAFTSEEFRQFLCENNISHVKIATGSPQANGQVERVNRSLAPMIAKLTSAGTVSSLDGVLPTIEFSMNNTSHKSIGTTPSQLLFGVVQKGVVIDFLKECLDNDNECEKDRDLDKMRDEARQKIEKSQEYNEEMKNRSRIQKEYKVGDYVMVKNFISNPGACKKIVPKFKGPYKVEKVLANDRYLLKDVEGFQLTQIPYEGVWEVYNIKPWVQNQ